VIRFHSQLAKYSLRLGAFVAKSKSPASGEAGQLEKISHKDRKALKVFQNAEG
jgi:hypothetical protein